MLEKIEMLIEELEDLKATEDWSLYEGTLQETEDVLGIEQPQNMEELKETIEDLKKVMQGMEDNQDSYSGMDEVDSYQSLGLSQWDFVEG